jgi:PilZ domain-containing protein
LRPSRGEERRRYGRVQLAESLPATVDGIPVHVVEISVSGARLLHEQRLPRAITNTLRIAWAGDEIKLKCEAVRSMLVKIGEYQSGVRFVNTGDESERLLRELIGEHVTRALNEQIANARGVPPLGGYTYQVGKGDVYRRCEFVGGLWRKTETRDSSQPHNGFTISADADPGQVQMLCQTWLACDEAGRHLTQILAQLSIDKNEGVPTRRYVP